MTTSCLVALNKSKEKRVQVLGVVESGYQTQKIKSTQERRGGINQKAKDALHSLKTKKKKGIRSEVPQDDSQVSVGGLFSLGYGRKLITRKER